MYSDIERGIFKFHNGELNADGTPKEVFADPMGIWRGLAQATTEDGRTYSDLYGALNEDATVAVTEGARFSLIGEQVALIRQVFGIKPLDPSDGSGLMEEESLGVLNQFNVFVDELKKKRTATDDSSASTDGPQVASGPAVPKGIGSILPMLDEAGNPVPRPGI